MDKEKNKANPSKDWKGFLEEFQNESPRAAAILGAAFLDVHLRQLIANFFIDDEDEVDGLLGIDRPLSTFSARIRTAYCLGLISKDECRDLNIIRKIRNDFAHRLHDLTFDDQDVINRCYSLKTPIEIVPENWVETPQSRFLVGVTILASRIKLRALGIVEKRRKVLQGFETAEVVE